jgi:DUF4097 and DUF4098 domain-containing protein YvlB
MHARTTILFAALLCLSINRSAAQKLVDKHLDFSQKNFLSLDIQIADSIRIRTWDKKEVYVKASIDVNDNKDNDAYDMTFDESGSDVLVRSKFVDNEVRRQRRHDSCNCDCNNYRSKIYVDVYIPEGAPFSVKTIDGNLIISGKTDEIQANSISGFIDLTMAPEHKADIRLNTITGTIYSNLAFNESASHKSRSGNVDEEYNGGGKPIELKTISGNIFLRKEE